VALVLARQLRPPAWMVLPLVGDAPVPEQLLCVLGRHCKSWRRSERREGKMHWTRESEAALVNALAMDLTSIVEEALEQGKLSREELRTILDVSNGRISQILSAPGNLTLRTMVRLGKACGKDITVVPYEYQGEERGPIHPQVFVAAWEAAGKPGMISELAESRSEESGPRGKVG